MNSLMLQLGASLALALLVGCSSGSSNPGAGGSPSRGGTTGAGGAPAAGGTATSNGGASTSHGGLANANGGSMSGGSMSGGSMSGGSMSGGSMSGGSMSGGSMSGGSNTGGAGNGGSNSGGATCMPGAASTITQVMKGTVASGSQVRLGAVVATSPKFLLSKGNAGACLWAVFVSEPIAQAVEYSGALIVTSGARAAVSSTGTVGDCPKGTDPIPDDTKPGDSLSISGTVTSYVRSDCATTTSPPPSTEVRISACAVQRDATGKTVPAPAAVPNIADLTNSATEATHRKWTGVLVKLSNQVGVDVTGTGPVGSTGTIRFASGVRTRDRIYQPATAAFGLSTTFSSVVGLLHLDVCQWSIEPRSPCTDFVPKSMNCP